MLEISVRSHGESMNTTAWRVVCFRCRRRHGARQIIRFWGAFRGCLAAATPGGGAGAAQPIASRPAPLFGQFAAGPLQLRLSRRSASHAGHTRRVRWETFSLIAHHMRWLHALAAHSKVISVLFIFRLDGKVESAGVRWSTNH